MMGELRKNRTDLNLEILGVNRISASAANGLITAGRKIPWLQDTAQADVWNRWQVTYRDVRILNSQNETAAVFNLSQYDLGQATNYAALTALFLKSAVAVDSDHDGFPDDWELRYFGNLAAGPEADADGDGVPNEAEFAFGSDPAKVDLPVPLQVNWSRNTALAPVEITFRRRAGGLLDYILETSTDLRHWTDAASGMVAVLPPQNLYNGAGLSDVRALFSREAMNLPSAFVRVRAAPAKPR
jgi:hypothetical protein